MFENPQCVADEPAEIYVRNWLAHITRPHPPVESYVSKHVLNCLKGVQLHFFLAIAPAKNVSLHHHLHRKVIFVHCLTNLQVGSQTLPCGGTSMPPWVWQGSKTAFFRKKFSPSLQRYLWLCQRHRTTWNPTVLRPWSQSRLNTKSRWKTPNHPEIDLENFGQFQIFQVKPSDVGTWNYISAGETPRCSWFYSILWGSTS